jgi:hypothetical protein
LRFRKAGAGNKTAFSNSNECHHDLLIELQAKTRQTETETFQASMFGTTFATSTTILKKAQKHFRLKNLFQDSPNIGTLSVMCLECYLKCVKYVVFVVFLFPERCYIPTKASCCLHDSAELCPANKQKVVTSSVSHQINHSP